MAIKTLNISQPRTVLPETKETNVMNPTIALSYCLEIVPKPKRGGILDAWWHTLSIDEMEI